MAFTQGPVNVTMLKLSQKLPENYLELFAAYAAAPLDQLKNDPEFGWTSGRHLMETKIDDQTAICGGHLYLNLRKAERKIPTVLMKTLCQREEQIYMTANETEFVPAKIKREIKLDIIDKHLMKMTPTLTGIPFVVDLASNMMYAGTTSQSQLDDLVCFFFKTTNVEPIHINIGTLCEDLGIQEADLPSVQFSDKKSDDLTPGRDFLTFLWYYGERCGGKTEIFELMIEAPLTFSAEASTMRGAAEVALKNGDCQLRSAEAKAALLVGKKLRKAKVLMCCQDSCHKGGIWEWSFDANKFAFSSLTLPCGEEMEHHSRFQERVQNLDTFRNAIQAYFKIFTQLVLHKDWPELEKRIQEWVLDRDSY